jgi:ADP-ribose pyrophosphatase
MSSVIELPAGLAGDIADQADETFRQACERELLEETGYVARDWSELATTASSAGLTDELVTFFRVENAEKRAAGGGDSSEDICVHEIPLLDVERWLSEAAVSGKIVDTRVYAGLYFVSR